MDNSITRDSSFKFYLHRNNLDVRKPLFSARVIYFLDSLANDTVCSTSLDMLKCLLHRNLGQRLFDYLNQFRNICAVLLILEPFSS